METRLRLVEEHVDRIDKAVTDLIEHKIDLDKRNIKNEIIIEKIHNDLKGLQESIISLTDTVSSILIKNSDYKMKRILYIGGGMVGGLLIGIIGKEALPWLKLLLTL